MKMELEEFKKIPQIQELNKLLKREDEEIRLDEFEALCLAQNLAGYLRRHIQVEDAEYDHPVVSKLKEFEAAAEALSSALVDYRNETGWDLT